MGWKKGISKFSGKMTKEKWLLLLLLGVLLMILAFPLPGGTKQGKHTESQASAKDGENAGGAVPLWTGDEGSGSGSQTVESVSGTSDDGGSYPASASAKEDHSYEVQLENRIKDILKSVDGVGKVEVMVALKSSGEKVVHVDRSVTSNTTREKDSGGGTRDVTSSESQESTVLAGGGGSSGNGGGNGPIIEKELSPEISGIIISAEGGGSPRVKAEISEAMEALFGLPPHKIKVLKRVE